jgi:hypothetical protein
MPKNKRSLGHPVPGYLGSPVPVSRITCGLDDALSRIETVPDFRPVEVGENVTLTVQFAPGATLFPHVEVTPNWALAFMDPIFKAVVLCSSG